VTDGLGFATEVGLDHLLVGGVLRGDIQELPHRVWGLTAERVDEHLVGCTTNEGIDDVGELVALGETLDVPLEGLVGPLPAVAEVPQVPGPSVRTLEVDNEDRTEIAPTVDAARLELLKPSSSGA
jgi:hypothetical protein